MAEVPDEPEEATGESTVETVTDGYFEEEYHVSSDDAGEFLSELGAQLTEGDEVTVTGDGWEIPFAFGEPVELEIEFEGGGEPELEIEVELVGRRDDEAPGLR
jgi:amphi-Trp domain-containing protein